MNTPTRIHPDRLPATIRSYLAAHVARDADAALSAFTSTAVVVDDGTTYRGSEDIRRFLARAGSEFTYTTTLVAAERTEDVRWVATNRLEGDFPGGVVDLRYRFAMDGDLIAELVIAP
jgi:ketosteroid isomerase-like protein